MSNSKQRRFAIGVTSLLLLSSCKPLLSSHGETHSPYQPSQKQNTQKTGGATASSGGSAHGTTGGTGGGHVGPGVPGASGATGSATAPTGAPASTNKDLDRALDEIAKTEVLKVTFNGVYEFPYDKKDADDFDSLGCRSLMVRGGMRPEKGKDDTHFSCQVRYCVYKKSDDEDTKYAFKIPQNTTFYFLNQNSDTSGDRTRHVRLHSVYSGDDVGSIDELQCDGMGGTLTVRDLIEAFGKSADGKQDEVTAQIASIASLFTPPAATGSQAPLAQPNAATQNMLRLNSKKVSIQSGEASKTEQETMGMRGLASVPAVSQTTRKDREKEREMADLPNFALQLTGSVHAFGGSTISPAQEGTKSGAMLLQLEYQPSFLQHFGILSIGPSFGTYPTLGSTQADEKVTPGFFAITGVGGQVRYQLHYFDNQFVVPYASYEAQSLSYRINGGGSGRLTVAGGSGGLSLLLNRLAPGEAIDMKQNLGVSRSYLVIEGKYLYGTDQNVRVSGTSVFFGLRFER